MATLTNAYNDTIKWYDNAIQNVEFELDNADTDSVVYTAEGYINFQTISEQEFFKLNTKDIIDITNIDLTSIVDQSNPKKPFKCNFSFNLSLSFNLKLPNINPKAPNLSLLYKIDEFSKEVAKVNDLLINAIRDMNCCDIEDAYNKTVVPFFRWFADHPDIKNCSPDQDPETGKCGPMFGSETLPYLMLKIAEMFIQIYIVLRPLACLLRPLPGNPWWPFDFDATKFIYGFLDFFDMYVDFVISGKLVDEYLLQPTRKFRQNLQNCITGNNSYQNTIKDNIIKNTINIIKIQKQIDLLNEKILNLESAANKYLNKNINEFNSYKIKIINTTENPIENITENFKTIFEEFTESFNIAHSFKYNPEKDPILQDYRNFLENYSDEKTLKYFIKNYYPKLKGAIEIVSTKDIIPEIIYKIENINYDYNENLDDGLIIWSQIFKNFISVIQNSHNYYYLYLQNKKQTNILKKTKNTLKTYIENLQKHQTQESPGVTSKDIILARYRNFVAKSDHPGNLCNCLIYTLFDDPKQPALYKIKTLFKTDMEKFLNKETISWKIEDYSLFRTYMYPDIKFDKKTSQLPLYFSKKFINELDKENKNALESIINKLRTSINLNENSYETIINILKEFESNPNIVSYGSVTNAFLDYLDKKEKENYYLIPTYNNWIGSVNLYDPYNNTIVNTGKMLIFDMNWIPKPLKPSEYYKKYLMPLYALLSVSKSILNNFDTIFYNKILKPDEYHFKKAREKAQALINSLQIIIETTDDLSLKIKLQDYLQDSQKLFDSFFNKYNPIDILRDSSEIEIRSYQNMHHPYQDIIESYFGTSIEFLINNYINERKVIFENNIELIYKKLYLYRFVTDLSNFIYDNGLFSGLIQIWVWEPLDIPCDCGIFCKIIQYIINLLLQGLNKILNSIINAIINWILNSWLGKLIKIILLKVKCILMFLRLKDDLDKTRKTTNALIESLKQRIHLYVDSSVCLLNLDNTESEQLSSTDDNISKLIDDTLNDVIDQETNGGKNPDDLLPDPNFTIVKPQININSETGDTEIDIGLNDSVLGQPAFQSQITAGLPAKLILSDGIEVKAINPETNFPLLNFNCNCTIDGCNECINDEKINNTLNFLKS